jgi:hypothetical protein
VPDLPIDIRIAASGLINPSNFGNAKGGGWIKVIPVRLRKEETRMKSSFSNCIFTAITLFATLAMSLRLSAQERPTPQKNPLPLINQPLVPDARKPGGAGFTLRVNGTGFVSSSVVNWNGSPRTTTFVSGSRLKASIPASDIAKAHTASVTVVNPSPGGGTSNPGFFEVTIPSRSIGLSASAFGAGLFPFSVATGDFDGDGNLDLAVADLGQGNGGVSVLLGNGDGTFKAAVNYGGPSSFSVAVGTSTATASWIWPWRTVSTARSACFWAKAMAPFMPP